MIYEIVTIKKAAPESGAALALKDYELLLSTPLVRGS